MKKSIAIIGVCAMMAFGMTAYADDNITNGQNVEVTEEDWDDDGEGEKDLKIGLAGDSGLGDDNGVESVETPEILIRIEREAGGIAIMSGVAVRIPVYRIGGVMVGMLDLEPGRNAVTGLSEGTYIIAGKKVRL